MIKRDAKPRRLSLRCPAETGRYKVRLFDTVKGAVTGEMILQAAEGSLAVPIASVGSDIALAVSRL
jgi:hypothetical protein